LENILRRINYLQPDRLKCDGAVSPPREVKLTAIPVSGPRNCRRTKKSKAVPVIDRQAYRIVRC
jgi:hypothetical protein